MLPEYIQQLIFRYWDITALMMLVVLIFASGKTYGNGIALLNSMLRAWLYPKYLDLADGLTWIIPVLLSLFLMAHIGCVHHDSDLDDTELVKKECKLC
jgi:hypothetical protein